MKNDSQNSVYELDIPSGKISIVDPGHPSLNGDITSIGRKIVYIHPFMGDGNYPILRINNGLEVLLETPWIYDLNENKIPEGLEYGDSKMWDLVLRCGSINPEVKNFFPEGKLTKEGVMRLREEGYSWNELTGDTLNYEEGLMKGIKRVTGMVGSVIVDHANIMLTDVKNARRMDLQFYEEKENSYDIDPGRYNISFTKAGKEERHYLFRGERILKIDKISK